jgi:putative ATP-binding cassette transporter
MMRVLRAVLREVPENLRAFFWINALSALATTAIIWLVASATQDAAGGTFSQRSMLLFGLAVLIYAMTHVRALVGASRDSERLVHNFRTRLFDLVRQADLACVEKIGHAQLQKVLIQDTQTLAQIMPLLAIGFQQFLMLVCLSFYVLYISPLTFLLVSATAVLAVAVRFKRVKSLHGLMQQAGNSERKVFAGLTDLLRGFKEVRMSAARAEGVVEALKQASDASEQTQVALKTQWGRNYAVVEAMFYALVGVLVFVVPLLTTDFHTVIIPAMTATLFISGPVGTIAFVAPMWAQADMALADMEDMEARLRASSNPKASIGEALPYPSRIALREAKLSHRDEQGIPQFTVGPVSADFAAGRVHFITGGNGSGKSTLLRMLTSLVPLDEGQLQADDHAIPEANMQEYRELLSVVFSDAYLSRRLYGIESLDETRVQYWLTRLQLQDKVHVHNGEFSTLDLSTGQRKRLALMRAMLEDRPVLILDEWAADQDPLFRRVFYEEILPELRAKGKTILCVTHDDRWFATADRIDRMDEGLLYVNVGIISPWKHG